MRPKMIFFKKEIEYLVWSLCNLLLTLAVAFLIFILFIGKDYLSMANSRDLLINCLVIYALIHVLTINMSKRTASYKLFLRFLLSTTVIFFEYIYLYFRFII